MKYQVTMTVPDAPVRGDVWFSTEDGGAAWILHMDPRAEGDAEVGGDDCFYVKLHSYDESLKHPLFRALCGKRIKVTVEEV